MRYYVLADVHGYYTKMIDKLTEVGFFDDKEPHKLILCGDMMDRGKEACKMQEFMYKLLQEDKLIFIRGNHEDLMMDMLREFPEKMDDILAGYTHHNSNRTFDTAVQLSKMSKGRIRNNPDEFIRRVRNSTFCKELIPAAIDYYETPDFIFVHGWIPHKDNKYDPDWRNASETEWRKARWYNGIDCAVLHDILEDDRVIVCGHWHTSYGHYYFGNPPKQQNNFAPFYGEGFIAMDGCTALSGVVNCIVIEEAI